MCIRVAAIVYLTFGTSLVLLLIFPGYDATYTDINNNTIPPNNCGEYVHPLTVDLF
jgi:hypothetical protein